MAIAKQKLMILVGPVEKFDQVAEKCVRSGVFQPEARTNISASSGMMLSPMDDPNPYNDLLAHIQKALDYAKIRPEYRDFESCSDSSEAIETELDQFEKELISLQEQIKDLQGKRQQNRFRLEKLMPLQDLSVPIEDLFSMRHILFHFGHMPRMAYDKMLHYGLPESVLMLPTSVGKEEVWGFWACPVDIATKTNAFFSALFFEKVPHDHSLKGIPADIISQTEQTIEFQTKELEKLQQQYDDIISRHKEHLLTAYSKYKYLSSTFDLRKYAARDHYLFYLYGWVPAKNYLAFEKELRKIEELTVTSQDPAADKELHPPTKIKNLWGVHFFEQFVNMYGVPGYNELDPTLPVAITYTLFFGIMFGDIGQGLVLFLLGLLCWFKLKMPLGRIISVIGLSSFGFGFFFGSFFGLEEWSKDYAFHVLHGNNTLFTLLFAAGVGLLLIIMAMLLNIFNGIKQKNFQKIFFDVNGVAGLMLFAGNLVALALTFLAKIKIYTPLFTIFFIVVPILAIFFRGPLGKLCNGQDWWPKKMGEYVMENFFELFEVFLSFLSNIISYVRIGAFAVSHAGMMLVVTSLADMMGGTGKIIVLIFGNILVIGLEGLIVGIQCLRLQFYEFFSRFYSGEGKEYKPLQVKFENE